MLSGPALLLTFRGTRLVVHARTNGHDSGAARAEHRALSCARRRSARNAAARHRAETLRSAAQQRRRPARCLIGADPQRSNVSSWASEILSRSRSSCSISLSAERGMGRCDCAVGLLSHALIVCTETPDQSASSGSEGLGVLSVSAARNRSANVPGASFCRRGDHATSRRSVRAAPVSRSRSIASAVAPSSSWLSSAQVVGCIERSPRSWPRSVLVEIRARAAASRWVSPAALRAVLISTEVGRPFVYSMLCDAASRRSMTVLGTS